MADVHHGQTLLEGCLNRFCANPPSPELGKIQKLKLFVSTQLDEFPCLAPDADVSQLTWLLNTIYPKHRKDELIKTWHDGDECIVDEDYENSSHGKRETYLKYKHARGINSRSDMFKCYSGPFFKLMEDVVYRHPAFIKHVPVRDRPRYIVDMLGGCPGPYYETDYSQFEKHFTPEVMDAVELLLYKHLLKNFPVVYEKLSKALSGVNKCIFKKFTLKILAKRMSGDMCTSLGNGFTNLMLFKFVAFEKGGVAEGVVEGDDALFYSSVDITSDDFKALGFDIKILKHDHLLQSSFCGLVMSEDLCTLTNPFKVLLNIGWTHSPMMFGGERVRKGLLRAKALSLAYEHPQCPILSALALTILSHTSGYRPRFESSWYDRFLEEEQLIHSEETKRLLMLGPTAPARECFANLFGISCYDQLRIEEYLLHWNGGPIAYQPLLDMFGAEFDDCRDYYDRFTS